MKRPLVIYIFATAPLDKSAKPFDLNGSMQYIFAIKSVLVKPPLCQYHLLVFTLSLFIYKLYRQEANFVLPCLDESDSQEILVAWKYCGRICLYCFMVFAGGFNLFFTNSMISLKFSFLNMIILSNKFILYMYLYIYRAYLPASLIRQQMLEKSA